jgi:predicted PilT family ATPase
MKYAFVFGSNAFITSQGVISYTDNGETKEFLRVNTTIKRYEGAPESTLGVTVDVTDTNGNPVKFSDIINDAPDFRIEQTTDRIKALKADGSIIIDIHELDDHSVQHLSHHITAEIDRYSPIAVIRLNGDFKAGDYHIAIDNEKLFIDGNSYAESVHVEHDGGLVFSKEGVLF